MLIYLFVCVWCDFDRTCSIRDVFCLLCMIVKYQNLYVYVLWNIGVLLVLYVVCYVIYYLSVVS